MVSVGTTHLSNIDLSQTHHPQKSHKHENNVTDVSLRALEDQTVSRNVMRRIFLFEGSNYGIGGCVVGAVAGLTIFACFTVVLWGPGAGLWVEGERTMRNDYLSAGQTLTIIAIGLTALGGCLGGVHGYMPKGILGSRK